jgi:hypothetical protein
VTKQTEIPDWETLLAQAAALHAAHRISFDHDHVIKDLAKNYDAAILALESIAGWRTHRRVKGKMVLGNVNKIGAGATAVWCSGSLELCGTGVGVGWCRNAGGTMNAGTMRFLSAAAAGLMLFGCAATPQNPNSKPATAALKDPNCLPDTGSLIASKSGCRGYGRSYSYQDMYRTGAYQAADALVLLDPSITIHR